MSDEICSTKLCSKCGVRKEKSQFHQSSQTSDGLQGHCKQCRSEHRKAHYRNNHDRIVLQNRAWKDSNREYHRAYSRAYNAKNRELVNKRSKEWTKNNPIKVRERVMRYEARKKNNAVSRVSYDAILQRDDYTCYICELPVVPSDVEFDHIVPLSRGGAHEESNIAVVHALCNKHKGARLPLELLRDDRLGEKPPTVVCLCGSTRFTAAYQEANLKETLAGNIVLTVGCDLHSDGDLFSSMSDEERDAVKSRLDELHLRKIEMAHEILVLNVDGYIGDSTRSEIEYARRCGKRIRYLVSPSEIVSIMSAIRAQNLREGVCRQCGGKLFADGSCSNWEREDSNV